MHLFNYSSEYAFYCINWHVHFTYCYWYMSIPNGIRCGRNGQKKNNRRLKSPFSLKCLHCFPNCKSKKLQLFGIPHLFLIRNFKGWKHWNSNLWIPNCYSMMCYRWNVRIAYNHHTPTYTHRHTSHVSTYSLFGFHSCGAKYDDFSLATDYSEIFVSFKIDCDRTSKASLLRRFMLHWFRLVRVKVAYVFIHLFSSIISLVIPFYL